jgi:outer membrane protein
MKIKVLTLSIISAINLMAIDINSAVNSAIKNNFSLKQQEYILESSKIDFDLAKKSISPRVDLNYNYNNKDKVLYTQTKEDSTASIKIFYNLFNGFKDKYNIDSYSHKYNYSKQIYEAFKQDFILEVKEKYINYLLASKNKITFDEELKLYSKQYKDSSNYYAQGLIAKNELLEVEVKMLQAKQNLQNAKANEKISKLILENIIGKKIDTKLEDIDLKDNINFNNQTVSNRSELKALQSLIISLENSAKSINSTYYPKIDTSLSYNSYSQEAFNNRDDQATATVNISYNLYDNQQDKLKALKLKNQVMQTKMALKDLELSLNLQLANIKEQLKVSTLNLETATKALKVSKLNFSIVENKLKEGISSNKDLIDANYMLTKSKQDYFEAYYNRYLNIAKFERIVGF